MNTPHKRSNPKSKEMCKKAGMKYVPGKKSKRGKVQRKGYCRKSKNSKQ